LVGEKREKESHLAVLLISWEERGKFSAAGRLFLSDLSEN